MCLINEPWRNNFLCCSSSPRPNTWVWTPSFRSLEAKRSNLLLFAGVSSFLLVAETYTYCAINAITGCATHWLCPCCLADGGAGLPADPEHRGLQLQHHEQPSGGEVCPQRGWCPLLVLYLRGKRHFSSFILENVPKLHELAYHS